MTRDELLQVEAARWGEISALFEGVGDRWDEPGATGDWTPRDVLAHITAWHEIALAWYVDTARTGQVDAPWAPWGDDLDAFNESLHQKALGISVADVRANADRARAAFVEAVAALPNEVSDRQIRVTTGNGHGHYEEHIPPLTAFLERA